MMPISKRGHDIKKALKHRKTIQMRVISGLIKSETIGKCAETDFIPVTICSPDSRDPREIVSDDQRIEIHFPDGIRIILTGADSLRSARQILETI